MILSAGMVLKQTLASARASRGGVMKRLLMVILIGAFSAAVARADADSASAIANRFQSELQSALMAAMAQGGPVQAVTVCRDEAPAIASRLSRETGWQVRRVGTRVRNPFSGLPDAWEQVQLAEIQRRISAGEAATAISIVERVAEPDGASDRYLKPIVVGPLCLACHGAVASQSAELRSVLQREYPNDAAVEYALGDLRGAFSLRRKAAPATLESR
jgi:hypothetical protein